MDSLRAAIIISVFGLFLLAALSLYLEPHQVPISSITPASIGTPVKIVGTLIRDNEYPNVRILIVSDGPVTNSETSPGTGSEITVPLFFEVEGLATGKTISVSGKVQLYKETLEVVPSSPRDIKLIQ